MENYTDEHEHEHEHKEIECPTQVLFIIGVIILVLIFLNNLILLGVYVFGFNKRRKKVISNILLVVQSLIDTVVGISLAFSIAWQKTNQEALQIAADFFMYYSITTSIAILVISSADRFVGVKYPLHRMR